MTINLEFKLDEPLKCEILDRATRILMLGRILPSQVRFLPAKKM